MTLDERLRTELRDAAELLPLRADDAVDAVYRRHDRDLVRTRRARQVIVAAVLVALFASVAVVAAWRKAPDHVAAARTDGYRSTATIRVAPKPAPGTTSTTIAPAFTPEDPRALALASTTKRAATHAAHLSAEATKADFRATLSPAGDILSLTVIANTRFASEALTRAWTSSFMSARKAEARRLLRAEHDAIDRQVNRLHDQLRRVDAELVRIDPARFKGRTVEGRYGVPNFSEPTAPPLAVPETASPHELDLANERVQLLSKLADIGAKSASTRITVGGPFSYYSVIAQTPAVRVHATSPKKASHSALDWAIGLVIVVLGAAFVYRRRARQVAA